MKKRDVHMSRPIMPIIIIIKKVQKSEVHLKTDMHTYIALKYTALVMNQIVHAHMHVKRNPGKISPEYNSKVQRGKMK